MYEIEGSGDFRISTKLIFRIPHRLPEDNCLSGSQVQLFGKCRLVDICPYACIQPLGSAEKVNVLGQKVLTGELTFDFEDGDGDLGFEARTDSLNLPDSVKYNLFLTLHEMVDGVYREVDTAELLSPPYYRIPPLDREGQNKTLIGEISVDIEYYIIEYDTLRYSFYITDRAFHRSNVDTTSEIIFLFP